MHFLQFDGKEIDDSLFLNDIRSFFKLKMNLVFDRSTEIFKRLSLIFPFNSIFPMTRASHAMLEL